MRGRPRRMVSVCMSRFGFSVWGLVVMNSNDPILHFPFPSLRFAISGAPKRGMGWYHAVQMLNGKVPSAALCYIVEPWFLGAGKPNRQSSTTRVLT